MLRRLNFSLWYLFHPPWDTGISPPELLDFIDHHPAGSAIDLGCGTGTNVVTLAQHGWQVTGVDFAAPAIRAGRRKIARAGVQASLSVGDVTQLSAISGPFDLALDIGCFHGVPSRSAYLAALSRVLIPGGYWLMYGFFRFDPRPSAPGLTSADIELVQASGFQLENRRDGFDRGNRPSGWFLFQRRIDAA
jgi:ubiquinone/menaquinone biosynthesis C-methylase UbiE